MLADTHCHLNFESFSQDREAVVERASLAGVIRILNPGIDLATSREAVELAEREKEVYAAVGVHPNDAVDLEIDWLEKLKQLARHPKVVAIGEIGLDDYWERTPGELQRLVFQNQLDLAAKLGLPVVIHSRDKATSDGPALRAVLDMLVEWQARLHDAGSELADRPGVLHSFSGDLPAARRAVNANFLIGITGPVTFKKAEMLREVAASLPETALVVETDAPFLTPHPHRGERNEPAYVRHICEKIAEIRQMEYEAIARMTSANAERLFRWKGIHTVR